MYCIGRLLWVLIHMPVEMWTSNNDRGMQTMILELIEGLCLSKIFLNARYTKVFLKGKLAHDFNDDSFL